ncbi:phage tail tape measure protein [Paracoccus alkanivorans]|nr:phage tail tape measure protein [Paracoccus alkanivorans]
MPSSIIGALRVNLGLDMSEFQAGLRTASNSLRNVGRDMQRIGQDLSLKVSAPIAGFGALAVRTAGNFEASMNRVGAVTGATEKQMAALAAQAKQLGATTQFSASQAADAIEVLAKNGLSVADIMGGALESSLMLAAASGTDLANAGDIATDVMLQFGKAAGDLAPVVDGITGVLSASKFGIDDYRLALAQAGGVAGGLGVEFEDFNAALAATSSLFASGSDAGTSFKTFLQRLAPQSAPAADAMRELGLEFFDAEGNMKSMAEVAQELQDGLAGLSDEAKTDALTKIFGQDALRTAIGLAQQGADGINELKVAIDEASATEQAEARMKGFNGEMRKLASAFEALQLAIAESGLLQFVTDIVQKLAELVSQLSQANPALLKWGTVLAGAAAAVGPVLIGFGLMTTAIAPLIKVMGGLVTVMRAVSLAFLANPIGLAAAAIAGAAVLIWQNWEKVGPWFSDLFASLGSIFSGFSDLVGGIVTGDMSLAVSGLKTLWGGLRTYYQTLWDGISGIFAAAWENAIKPITDALGLTDEITAAWRMVQTVLEAVLDAVAAKFQSAWNTIKPIIDKLKSGYDQANQFLNRATGANKGPISSGYDPSTDPGDAGLMLPPTSGHMVEGLAAGTSGAADQGRADAEAYSEGWREGMGIRSPSRVMQEIGQYITQGLQSGIITGSTGVRAASDNLGQGIKDNILTHFSGITQGARSLSDVFDNIKTSFANMLSDMGSRLFASGLSGLLGSLFGGGDPLTSALRGIGLPAIPGFANGVTDFGGGLARINERGGELVNLPGGSTVIPHDLSRRMLNDIGNGQTEAGQMDLRVFVDQDGNWQARVEQISKGVATGEIRRAAPAILSQVPKAMEEYRMKRG